MSAATPLLQDSLLLIWNNRNKDERLALMEKIYWLDMQFFESDGAAPYTGLDDINTLIGTLQQNWPAEFVFTLQQPVIINHNLQHAAWVLGAPGQPPAVQGVDVAIIEDGKIKALYLFMAAQAE